MRTKLLLAFVPLGLFSQPQPVRTVTSQAQRVGNQPIPGFQNGYLYWFDGATVRVYGPDGWPVLATVMQIPNAEHLRAEGLAVSSDGAFAVGFSSRKTALMGGITFYDKNGQPDGFVATGSYVPANLCFADDQSLWAFGTQQPGSGDYMMVRHFSADRKDAGQFLTRSLFPKGLEPGMSHWQTRGIWVGKDRIGLLAFSGSDGSLNEWVELDLSGKLLRRVRLDEPEFTPMAFTADGRLYRKADHASALQMLNATTSEWQDAGVATLGSLLGADGNSLVFSPTHGIGPITMQWFRQPTESETHTSKITYGGRKP
jgi:hypothetical protein